MQSTRSLASRVCVILWQACVVVAQSDGSDARSLSTALQNINGMSSIFSLLPVLTGKTQNVKAIAARTFPGSLAVTGLGAGRVLSKLQVGIMLLSANLYRNLVGELSYFHQEYVNVFSPPLVHIPTGTPERHSSNTIVNHNITEDYMVEAWFQTQGLPAKVELSQRNTRRMVGGLLVYFLLYALETFLSFQNAATGAGVPLIVLQAVSGTCWAAAICALQVVRGQGLRYIHLNRLATAEYRCFQLVTAGKHVRSAVLSIQLSNVREYNIFGSEYESTWLKAIGAAMVVSGVVDIFTTVLVVGLNVWAYGWLGMQVLLIAVKVIFSLEPIRRIPIVNILPLPGDATSTTNGSGAIVGVTSSPNPQELGSLRLPIIVDSSPDFCFQEIRVSHNIIVEAATRTQWRSRTPGLFIGQPYYARSSTTPEKSTASPMDSQVKSAAVHVVPVSSTEPQLGLSALSISPTSSVSSKASSDITAMPASLPSQPPPALSRGVVSVESNPPPKGDPTTTPLPPSRPPSSASSTATRAPTPPAKPTPQTLMRATTHPARGPLLHSAAGPPTSNIPRKPPPVRSSSQPSVPHATSPAPPSAFRRQVPAKPGPPASPVSPIAPSPTSPSSPDSEMVRYLALGKDGNLTLSAVEPAREGNQALQREFIACLGEVVRANKIPSAAFLHAVDVMREGIRRTMDEQWFAFGTKDLAWYMSSAYLDLLWRRFI